MQTSLLLLRWRMCLKNIALLVAVFTWATTIICLLYIRQFIINPIRKMTLINLLRVLLLLFKKFDFSFIFFFIRFYLLKCRCDSLDWVLSNLMSRLFWEKDVYYIIPCYILWHSAYTIFHLFVSKCHFTAVLIVIISCL